MLVDLMEIVAIAKFARNTMKEIILSKTQFINLPIIDGH